jgi:HK97 family phage major capsid protein
MDTIKGQVIERTATLERGDNDDEIYLSISSDTPAQGIWGREILVHSAGAIDLSRIEKGAVPLLYNHSAHPQLGVIKSGAVKGGKLKLRGIWDKDDPEVKPLYDKWRRGFLASTSVRARIHDYSEDYDKDGAIMRVTKWELLEASLVSMPEDPNVGSDDMRRAYQFTTGKDDAGNAPMDEATQVLDPPETINIDEIRREAAKTEGDRIRAITAMGEKYGNSELAKKLIHEGAATDIARNAFSDFVFERLKSQSEAEKPATIGLSKKENQQYSIIRAIYAAKTRNWDKAGLELEASRAAAKLAGTEFNPDSGRLHIPASDLTIEREFLAAAKDISRSAQAGQANNVATLVTEDFRSNDLIALGYETSLPSQLGITFIRNLQGTPIRFPRQTAGLSFAFRTETGQITESDMAFNDATMTPKEFGGLFYYTYLAAHQAQIPMGLEAFARADFSFALGEFYTTTLLNGSGAAGPPAVPQGLLNVAGMNTITRPANGGPLDPDEIKDLVLPALRTKLVNRGQLSVLSTLNYCNYLSKLKDSQGRYIWLPQGSGTIADGYPKRLWNMPLYESTHMPENLTKGTGTDLSALLVGPFSRAVIMGEWYGLMIDTSKEFKFDTGLEAVRILGNMDILNRMPDTFGIVNDIDTTAP